MRTRRGTPFSFNTASIHDWAYPRCALPPEPRHVNALAAVNAVTAGSCGAVAGDMDCDDTFSSSDFGRFVTCMNGPADSEPIGGGCACADFPESPPDGDVDLRDFIHFQRAYSGGGSAGTVTLDLVSPEAGQSVEPGATIHWSVTATVSPSDNAGLAAVSVDMVQDSGNNWRFDIPPATVVGSGMEGFSPPDGIANPQTAVAGSGYGGTPVGTTGSKNLWQIGGAQNTFGEAAGTGTDFIVDPQVGQTGAQVVAERSFPAPNLAGTYVYRIENGLANVLTLVNPPPSPPASWPVTGANVILNSSSFSFTVSHNNVAVVDFDGDGDVDQCDFGQIQRCYAGTQTLTSAFPDGSCNAFDVNGDDHVDGVDITIFQNCWSGPNVPADVLCADCNADGIFDIRQTETELGENPPDGILLLGRPRCRGGNTSNCDDNCPCVYNPDQADADGDGIGDACESP